MREEYQRGGFEDNVRAMADGPQVRKHWNKGDMRFRSGSERQSDAIQAWFNGCHLALLGSAGTGKTLLATYLACSAMLGGDNIDKIIIVRSAVQGRDLGHLPGTVEEKAAVYEKPYVATFGKLFSRIKTYEDMKEAGKVVFETTSFNRGVTWDNAVIILDEVQNCTFEEINTACTRLGDHSRLIVCGDTKQVDLSERYHEISGIEVMTEIVKDIDDFESVFFTRHDIIRSGFVKAWISAVEDYRERTGTEG